jgi:hypothetical protein
MKTSNKILVITFLLSVSLIYALPVAVNIKYKNGDYSIAGSDGVKYVNYSLSPGKLISIDGLKKCVIVPSDSFRIGISEGTQKFIMFKNSGDSLIIISKTGLQSDSSKVILYLPFTEVEKIISNQSSIELKGSFNKMPTPSYSIDLRRSHLSLQTSAVHQFFNRIHVVSYDSSSLAISKFNHIKELISLNLSQTNINSSTDIEAFQTRFDPKAIVDVTKNAKGIEINSRSR